MSPRTLVIGDVHGCAITMRALVEESLRPTPDDKVYLLGDLIDRGPDSKGVLDYIFELRERGLTVSGIRGNHEEMFLLAADNKYSLNLWKLNGGLATLASFQTDHPDAIPRRYHDALSALPYHIILPGFILVHAGLNFTNPSPFNDTEAMLWTRSSFVNQRCIGGRQLICGHTAVTRTHLVESLSSSKIMLDNGCVFIDNPEMGSLAALELENMKLYFQPNIDFLST